ncbi:MAG: protoheme IX farnesyltransferase [Gammaproteobacteria bacterium]|nr:protoheme IX farnesyltransferase [Gammaproteobacteria bacterium]
MEQTLEHKAQATSWRDYLELTKPKVVALILLTAIVGMHLATPGAVPLDVLILGTLGIGLAAGSAAAVNHIVDRRIDAIMARTTRRPVPQGKVSPLQGAIFAGVLAVASMLILALYINPLTAWLTLGSLVGYAFFYTLYLKRATPQNIVIGGLSGAAPPLLGWTAVTGSLDPHALLLVLIIYTWTPPHFWALAIHRAEDYAKAGIPMLPVTHGIPFTKTAVLLYTVLLSLSTLLPYLVGMSGLVYLIGALVLGFVFLGYAVQLRHFAKPQTAIKTFGYSIVYLMGLFVVLLVDHYLPRG